MYKGLFLSIMLELHLCQGIMLLHLPCHCCGSVPCPSSVLVWQYLIALCLLVSMLKVYCDFVYCISVGIIAPHWCVSSDINIPHWWYIGIVPMVTKSSPCIRHCALVPHCSCPMSLMRPRCPLIGLYCCIVDVKRVAVFAMNTGYNACCFDTIETFEGKINFILF